MDSLHTDAIICGPKPVLRDWRSLPGDELTRGERVCLFIERYCRVPEGKLVGRPMRLLDFQVLFILAIYDNPHGTRTAILSLARKNGKSAVIAALLLAHICGPEAVQNSQLVSGATSRDQAALVYTLAEKMIMASPQLLRLCTMVPSHKAIRGSMRNTSYRALSADATRAHGQSPVLVILDEVGQLRGPTSPFVDALTTAQGAHDNPLLIAISTSAAADADMFSMWIDDAERSQDPHIVCHVYKASETADLMDRNEWLKANPALGVFRSEKDLRAQIEKAQRLPALENAARNLLLNQRISLDSLWLAPSVWRKTSGQPDIAAFQGNARVALGLDLSQRQDLTAAVLAAQDFNGVVHLLVYAFTPSEGIESRAARDRVPYGPHPAGTEDRADRPIWPKSKKRHRLLDPLASDR